MCVLIIEDDPGIRDLLVETLSDEGYVVLVAENGQDALDFLAKSYRIPRLILLDLMMPVMDGLQFAQELQKDPVFASIPIALMSAGINLGHAARLFPTVEQLQKPIDIERLLTLVEHHCGGLARTA